MKSVIIGSVMVIALLVGGWVYLTRAPSAPSESIMVSSPEVRAVVDAALEEPLGEDVVYRILQEESLVTFSIDEVLRGEDFTVVGATDQVAGDVTLVGNDLTDVEFGSVRVNARTLKTDSTQRDGAISRAILRSEQDEYEFIMFEPTSVVMGEVEEDAVEVPMTIAGDLTVVGTSKSVTFEGTMQRDDEDTISGQAEATIMYKDFGLVIPQVPFVAGVDDNVILTIDFVANRLQ